MTDTAQIDALSALLDEKRRYEGWLAQLESRRDAAPGHVVERVRGDYTSRLRSVTDQLRGRAADLESSAADLAARISTLAAEEAAHRDERAETELRAAVGELAADAAGHSMAQCDDQISRISSERGVLGSELARVQDILLQVHPPAPRAAPAPLPDPAGGRAPASSVPPSAPSAQTAAPGAPAFDDLAFLQAVVRKEPPVAPSPLVDPLRTSSLDYLAPGALSAPRRTPPDESAAVRAPAMTPDSMAAFFKDVPTEQVKTLKCQECGTMNYPTEWYCERCGGELAAM